MVLRELRRRLTELREHRAFYELFDLIAGTSTGALIALALSLRNEESGERFNVSDLMQLYEHRGAEIFPPSFQSALHTAVQAFRHKYSPEPFERLLRDVFGNQSLRNAATNLLITSFDTEAMQPHCLKQHPYRLEWQGEDDYYVRDVARASAAAPTYFPPAHIAPIGSVARKFSLIDGAMFANNPSGLAYVESTKLFPEESEFLVLSIGTGDPQHGYSYEEVHSWGYLEWVNPMKGFPIGAIMSAGQSEAVSHQPGRMSGVRYVRMNVPLNGCSLAMDDASPKNLSCLAKLADRIIEEHDTSLDEVCGILAAGSARAPSTG